MNTPNNNPQNTNTKCFQIQINRILNNNKYIRWRKFDLLIKGEGGFKQLMGGRN